MDVEDGGEHRHCLLPVLGGLAHVADVEGELSAGHVEHRAASVLAEPVHVHRGRHDHHLQQTLADAHCHSDRRFCLFTDFF